MIELINLVPSECYLAMYVAAHRHGCADWLYVGLLHQDITHHFAEHLEVALGQILALFGDLNPLVDISHFSAGANERRYVPGNYEDGEKGA